MRAFCSAPHPAHAHTGGLELNIYLYITCKWTGCPSLRTHDSGARTTERPAHVPSAWHTWLNLQLSKRKTMNEPIITIYTIAPCSARRSIYQVELTRARLSLSYLICPTKRPINKMFNFINIIYLLTVTRAPERVHKDGRLFNKIHCYIL